MPELRDLPSVDDLLRAEALRQPVADHGLQAVRNEIRRLQHEMRRSGEAAAWAATPSAYAQNICATLRGSHYQPVFNMTGTVIHTNLGRGLLSDDLWDTLRPLVTRPINLEYDLHAGKRGDRDAIIEQRLQRLTGCEAATVVNNNAAALLLVLNTFALGGSVPVSRGELIEIGGSFRLPELMLRSGCTLVEVGTTNRTHVQDFAAVLEQASMLLKVHPSNYHISGFAHEVSAEELAELARTRGIPTCVDLGSGTLVDLTHWGLPAEPTPQSVLKTGIDLVTFSGDKLLGGVQAGVIVGRRDLLDAIKQNPMKRALRADKITLAALEATLKLYETPESLPHTLPLLRTLTLAPEELDILGEAIIAVLPHPWSARLTETTAQIGSGALPDKTIASRALALAHPALNADQMAARLRDLPNAVIGRISGGSLLLDLRGAQPLSELLQTLSHLAP